MTLTRELIDSRFPAPVEGQGRASSELTRAETMASLEDTLRSADENELWLFGYGSLMWKPELEFVESRLARLTGFHRRFCLWQWRYRGNRNDPNLMLALEPGGSCAGLVFRVVAPGIGPKVETTWRREMLGDGYRPRWMTALTPEGPVRAVAFVANRNNDQRYAGRLEDQVVARYIARACGEKGCGAEYLLETVLAMEQLGLRDSMLWRVQNLVAEHLAG
jgi:cation transport protein ChaC